jgi:hypothetical protein
MRWLRSCRSRRMDSSSAKSAARTLLPHSASALDVYCERPRLRRCLWEPNIIEQSASALENREAFVPVGAGVDDAWWWGPLRLPSSLLGFLQTWKISNQRGSIGKHKPLYSHPFDQRGK